MQTDDSEPAKTERCDKTFNQNSEVIYINYGVWNLK